MKSKAGPAGVHDNHPAPHAGSGYNAYGLSYDSNGGLYATEWPGPYIDYWTTPVSGGPPNCTVTTSTNTEDYYVDADGTNSVVVYGANGNSSNFDVDTEGVTNMPSCAGITDAFVQNFGSFDAGTGFPGGEASQSTGTFYVNNQYGTLNNVGTYPGGSVSSSCTWGFNPNDVTSISMASNEASIWGSNINFGGATLETYLQSFASGTLSGTCATSAAGGPTASNANDEFLGLAAWPTVQKKRNKRNRPAEIGNWFPPNPPPCGKPSESPCPTDFEVVYDGNVTADIPSCDPVYGPYNLFCPASQGPGNPCPPTVTYNPSPNGPCGVTSPTGTTTVTYSGSTLNLGNSKSEPNNYHFGLLASQDQTTWLADKNICWTYPSTPPVPEPNISINSKAPLTSTNWAYAVVYVAGSTSPTGPATFAQWDEISYVPNATDASGQPKFSFKNYGTQVIYVTNSGVVLNQAVSKDPGCLTNPGCAQNMVLLGNLDEAGFGGPPGSPSSEFVKLSSPPRHILKPITNP